MSPLTTRSYAHHYGTARHARHYLYRCYDAEGRLLYIGCTVDTKKRIAEHRRGKGAKASRWLSVCMASVEVDSDVYIGRVAGRAAERAAIQTEQPLFNYQERANEYQAAHMTRRAVAQYLLEHGHRELAEQTVCQCWPEYRNVNEADPLCVPHAHLALPESESRAFDEPESVA